MKNIVKRLFNEAKDNLEFQNELMPHEPKWHKPKWYWGDEKKVLYATVYMGWKIGKGTYNESNYLD